MLQICIFHIFCQNETLFLCYKTYFSKKSSTFARFLLGIEGREYFCLQFRYKRVVFETSSTYGTLGDGFTGSNSHSFSTSTSLGNSFCGCSDYTTSTSSHTSRNFSHSQTHQTFSGSFVTIHRNNIAINDGESGAQSLRRVIQFPGEDYETPPTGELDDSFASPVGDVLLPLLLMAAAYAVVRWFKNWKRKRTGNRLFCIK